MKVPPQKTDKELTIENLVLIKERDLAHDKAINALAARDRAITAFNDMQARVDKAEREVDFLKAIIKTLMER